jgi:hypothetical protein
MSKRRRANGESSQAQQVAELDADADLGCPMVGLTSAAGKALDSNGKQSAEPFYAGYYMHAPASVVGAGSRSSAGTGLPHTAQRSRLGVAMPVAQQQQKQALPRVQSHVLPGQARPVARQTGGVPAASQAQQLAGATAAAPELTAAALQLVNMLQQSAGRPGSGPEQSALHALHAKLGGMLGTSTDRESGAAAQGAAAVLQ